MNTETKEISHIDFDFKKTPKIEVDKVKPKKSLKKIISLCVLSAFIGGGVYGYNKVDNLLNPPAHVYQHKMLFTEHTSITPEEQAKINNIYSRNFERDTLFSAKSQIPTYYFNNSADIQKAYSILELNKGNKQDYSIEKTALNQAENYFLMLLQDKITSDLLKGKSPKELSIGKLIDPTVLSKYQSIYEEMKPQFIQSDTKGNINYKLNKEYALPEINNTTYQPKDYSARMLSLTLIRDAKILQPNSNNNINLWD